MELAGGGTESALLALEEILEVGQILNKSTEEYNGTSWTSEANALNTSRISC